MRIHRVRVEAFGRLSGLDTGPCDLPDLVAVLGPNEAGKTTFFRALTTLLYGFRPAKRETHPYAPWGGGDIEAEAQIELSSGERWEVHRRLTSSPTGSLIRGDRRDDLRNRPLPCAMHVPRAVFQQVFALTLTELAALKSESWEAIEDRLTGAMGARDLRSARVAAQELEKEAGTLWRPNRRGRQRVTELRERAALLRHRRESALALDVDLRGTVQALEDTRRRLAEAREERERCRAYVERFRLLQPIRSQLRRVGQLEAEAGSVDELLDLPADPRARLGQLERQIGEAQETLARVRHETTEPRRRIEAYGGLEERTVRSALRIEEAGAAAAEIESERLHRDHVQRDLEDIDRRSSRLAARLFGDPLPDGGADAVQAVDCSELRRRVRTYQGLRECRRILEEAGGTGERSPPVLEARGLVGVGVGGLAGAAALTIGIAAAIPSLAAVGVATVAAAATAVALQLRTGRSRRRRRQEEALGQRERLRGAREAEREALANVADLVEGLPLSESVLQDPDLEVVDVLERLRELHDDHDARVSALKAVESRIESARREIDTVARELDIELPAQPKAAARTLRARLREAELRRSAATNGRRELERLTREMRRHGEDLSRLQRERDELRSRLTLPGEKGLERGIRQAQARLEALQGAQRLRAELERSHPDLDEIVTRIEVAEAAVEDWAVDENAITRMKVRVETLNDRVEQLVGEPEALQKDVERLRKCETADEVEGELMVVEQELTDLVRQRDRAWVLAKLLRESDRRLREEHQPDVLRRASTHLATITAGRYDRVLVGEGARQRVFLVAGAHVPGPVAVDGSISTGTREQVYLSLRLAIVDHLDAENALPLFVDEALVNWDARRLQQGIELLVLTARRRQVFVFTCHDDLARVLEERGGRTLRLSTV